MDHINEFGDERQKAWCLHCARALVNLKTNRDHVPTKTLLHAPYPENLPVVEVCAECNEGFSSDEQYLVAFLGSVVSGSTEPSRQRNPNAARILSKKARLRARIERSKTEYKTLGGEERLTWKAEIERVKHVVLKNARGHAFFELGEPMLGDPSHVSVLPLLSLSPAERHQFESAQGLEIWPEVGSRMMTRLLTGQDLDDGWVIVQDDVYRYAVSQMGGVRVKSVLSEYLATEVAWN